MDKDRRNNLRIVIRACRKILIDDIKRELLRYGFGADISVEPGTYLKDKELEDRKRIEEAIEKERVGELTEEEALERYIKQSALTFLNRLAALRALEVRNLIEETVIPRDKYGGRSLRERNISDRAEREGISPYEALKRSLNEAFSEMSKEVKILFDPDSEYSIIFPSEKACRDVIKMLSIDVTEDDWSEDDIIGWVYQYFNDESREEFKKEKRAPKADDIPVINQFYTPHWIVKMLVDNSLGKLWLEMHPESEIRNFCDYMLPSHDLKKREPKRARDIKVIDPACGSGHFLLYTFDVLYRIYEEEGIRKEEIPELILENNLYGIDIDFNAVQLASFALYMKAKKYGSNVKSINIVCADVRIPNGKKRVSFLRKFDHDPELQQIFAKLFEDLGYTYEIGSLLKVRKPFEELFERRKAPQQARFLLGQKTIDERFYGQMRFSGSDETSMVVPRRITIEEMLKELKNIEPEMKLFASETEKSVGLLSLLSDRYDVLLMNPPYGDMPPKTKEYLRRYYPNTHFDYYAAFIEQAVDLVENKGYIGALTGKTFMFLKSYRWLRENVFGERAPPRLVFDLGPRVLDVATANWAAFIAQKDPENKEKTTFIKLDYPDEPEKRGAWEKALDDVRNSKESEIVFQRSIEDLKKIPGMPFSYWATDSLISLFEKYPPLDRDIAGEKGKRKIADVKHGGLDTGNDVRFTRFWWEVDVDNIATSIEESYKKKWVPFTKSGKPFYHDVPTVVNWYNNGEELKKLKNAWISNKDFYFREGLIWASVVSPDEVTLEFYKLPRGTIFRGNTHALFTENLWPMLAFGNARLPWYIFLLLDSTAHRKHCGYVSKIPVAPEIMESKKLEDLAKEAYSLLYEWDTGNEVSTHFIMPWILQAYKRFSYGWKPVTGHPLCKDFEWSSFDSAREIRGERKQGQEQEKTITQLANECIEREKKLRKRIEEIEKEIDDEVYRIYQISDEDRKQIEATNSNLELNNEREEGEDEEVKKQKIMSVKDHVERLLSYYIKRAIESKDDGIIMVDDLFEKVLEFISEDFGKDRRDKIENEINKILGKNLDSWIAEDYSELHVSMYQRRPIFWQLVSSGFSCFINYHKLTKDTIPKILGFYLPQAKKVLEIKSNYLHRELEEAKTTNNRKKKDRLIQDLKKMDGKLSDVRDVERKLKVLNAPRERTKAKKWVDRAIAEVRDNGWNPNLDYGVRVNIEPLKELKLLHSSTNRVK